jgi:hypothetical protein
MQLARSAAMHGWNPAPPGPAADQQVSKGKIPNKIIPVPHEYRRDTLARERDVLVNDIKISTDCTVVPHWEVGVATVWTRYDIDTNIIYSKARDRSHDLTFMARVLVSIRPFVTSISGSPRRTSNRTNLRLGRKRQLSMRTSGTMSRSNTWRTTGSNSSEARLRSIIKTSLASQRYVTPFGALLAFQQVSSTDTWSRSLLLGHRTSVNSLSHHGTSSAVNLKLWTAFACKTKSSSR